MKLAKWSVHFYSLPYEREVVWANAVERSGLYALLRIESDTGVAGIAEGTIKDTWSGVSPRSLEAALADLVLPLVKEVNLEDARQVASALAKIPENRLAKGMVDDACWTLRAAAAGKPLWQLLGAAPEAEVCWTVTRAKPADMAAEAAHYCGRYGFRTLKVKGGQGVDTDLRAMAEIRAAVGEGVALYVDANSHYPRAEAHDYVARIAEAGATIAEDPCPLVPDAAFESLQKASPIPILVDNTCTSAREADLYLARGARAVSLKPGRIGLSESLAIGERVRKAGGQSACGIYAESTLGTLINLQIPAQLAAEQTFFLMLRAQVTSYALDIKDGKITLPTEPALERLVDWTAVQQFGVRATTTKV